MNSLVCIHLPEGPIKQLIMPFVCVRFLCWVNTTEFKYSVCYSTQKSCQLWVTYFSAAPPIFPWLTPPPHFKRAIETIRLSFRHSSTARHLSALVTIYSLAQCTFLLCPSTLICIHCHISTNQTKDELFLVTPLVLFFFPLFAVLIPEFKLKTLHHSNLSCQSHSLVQVPTKTYTHTHTPIWNSYQRLYKSNTSVSWQIHQ